MTPRKRAARRSKPYDGPRVWWWQSRWRDLLPEQRDAVLMALEREQKRLMACAARADGKRKGSPHEPWRGNYAARVVDHAAKAGAMRIAREMLDAAGGYGD